MAYINGNRILNVQLHGGVGGNITVDDFMSNVSTNPVQNKVIKGYIDAQHSLLTTKLHNLDISVSALISRVDNCITFEEVTSVYDPESTAPVNGVAVAAACAEVESTQLKWKTVLNTTLTEEQAGVTFALIAIDDVESFANARQIKVYVSMPQESTLKANDFWFTIIIRDKDASIYNRHLIGGYNTAGSSKLNLESYTIVDVINAGVTGTSYKRSYTSVGILPNPHRTAPANSSTNAKIIAGGWHSASDFKKYPPYVQVNASTEAGVFRAGTKIYVEVLA